MAWRVVVSFLFGIVSVLVAMLGGRMWERYPEAGIVCFLACVLLILMCMCFAQDDGRIRGVR